MDLRHVDDQNFLTIQNRFRGLVANLRSRGFVDGQSRNPVGSFRSGLSKLYLDMRSVLSQEQYPIILEWVSEQIKGQLSDVVHAPVSYDELSGIYTGAVSVSLDRELLWIGHRIRGEMARLGMLPNASEQISQAMLAGRYEDALTTLKVLQQTLGVNLWSVQLRLALEQQAGGLESQKRYCAEVRRIYKRGFLGFTAYHTSVCNEDRTSLAKFLDDIEGRIERHAYYDDALKTYARYRLKGELPATDAGLADVMRIEQSHSMVDVYQTSIAVMQEIVSGGPTEARQKILREVLDNFPADDFRVAKLVSHLHPGRPIPAGARRPTDASDALFVGDVARSARLLRGRRKSSTDPWDLIYSGFAHAHRRPVKRERPAMRPDRIVTVLAAILGRAPDAENLGPQLSKLSFNLRGLPVAAGLRRFEDLWMRARPDAEWRPHRIGLHSPTYGIEDHTAGRPPPDSGEPATPTAAFWRIALLVDPGPSAHGEVGKLASAWRGILRSDLEDAIAETVGLDRWPRPLRELGVQLRLHALYARGDRAAVIDLIAREGSRGPSSSHFLPVEASLRELGWPDYQGTTNPLAAPIGLSLLWGRTEDSKTASLLRFATSHALRVPVKRRPSSLEPAPASYSQDELVYFLRHVCVPDILDQSRVVTGTRGIMEERQAVCSLLIELDGENTAAYNEEITSIAEQLAIDEGRWIVDSTRIYVDTEALLRWARRELQEDFGRYRDLAGVEVGHAQSFDDVLRELLETNPANRSGYTPENEAEAVLFSMLRRLGQEFLSNPIFGLDFNLSKRVRHQSFIGLIRGPIETSQLITTRESEAGEYRRNDYWLDKFTKGQDEIDEALRKFAAHFDDTLIAAKDTALHLRSSDKPEGLIVLNLSARLIAIARGIIGLDVSFDEFVSSAITILWNALEISLQATRELISVELKARLIEGFDELRASVRKVAEGDPAFLEFDAAAGNGSADVQNKLDEAASWFQHADRIRQETAFTLEQVVKIAVETALKSQRNYEPMLHHEVDGDLLMYAGNLIFVHDVLFVALGNAQKHSGLKTPRIDVRVRHDAEASTLMVEAICDSRAVNRPANEKRVEAIRALIASGSIAPRTRKEGGSGFVKLAAVVSQSKKGGIDFGYTDEGRFRLTVTYGLANLPEGAALAA